MNVSDFYVYTRVETTVYFVYVCGCVFTNVDGRTHTFSIGTNNIHNEIEDAETCVCECVCVQRDEERDGNNKKKKNIKYY